MTRVLITGMSGTGKSTVIEELSARGYAAVDLEDDWCVVDDDGVRLWDVDKVTALLDRTDLDPLVVSGGEENLALFLPKFDYVVLLSAPWATLDERLARRATNAFGRSPQERAKVRADQEEFEPRLRRIAHVEIDTRVPLADVVARVVQLLGVA